MEGSRIPGVQGSSGMLKNYKELNVWEKSYKLCLGMLPRQLNTPHGCRSHEGGNPERYWMPDQVRHDGVRLFIRQVTKRFPGDDIW